MTPLGGSHRVSTRYRGLGGLQVVGESRSHCVAYETIFLISIYTRPGPRHYIEGSMGIHAIIGDYNCCVLARPQALSAIPVFVSDDRARHSC